MKKIKILSVIGTRPEAVKMAPVIKAMENDRSFSPIVCVTGQHGELLDQVVDLFKIKPDIDLDLMSPNQSLRELTVNVLNGLERVFNDIEPDWVLIQGDTTTVMSAALLAYYKQIKIGHIEAGLRTYDIHQPFPEEVNRRIAGIVSSLHFAPTVHAQKNLVREGIPLENVIVTGNTVIDAVQMISKTPFDVHRSVLSNLPKDKSIFLITAHRRENFGEPLINICRAILKLADEFQDQFCFVCPVHPNPNVKKIVMPLLGEHTAIKLLDPISYREFIYLIETSVIILSDSGGIQEEAPAFKKPVLVLRDKTERPEGVKAGISILVGTDVQKIYNTAKHLLTNSDDRENLMQAKNPYGDGKASQRIISAIKEYYH